MAEIGAMLREARLRENLEIADLEARTKIRARYLRALEDEEWALLPGYTYARSFLRTYADMVGLDGRAMVDEFKRQHPDPSEPELAPPLPPRRDARRGRERPAERARSGGGPSGRLLLAALLVALIAAALFLVHELRGGTAARHATTSTTGSSTAPAKPPTRARRVALTLAAITPVRVCLIGYTKHGRAHQRLPPTGSATHTALLAPDAGSRTYHADTHFVVSFANGAARLTAAQRSLTVHTTGTTVAYEITASAIQLLPPAAAPRCS
jgi:cytoskeletal protein RodZ